MTEEMTVLIGQMEMLAALIFLGFFGQRAKLLTSENIDHFSTIVTRMILPFLLLTSVGGGGSREQLFGMWKFFLCTVFMLSLALLIGFCVSRVIGLQQPTKNMHILVTALGNGGFIGMPLIAVMFPKTSGLVIAVFAFVEAAIYWVVGPAVADTRSKGINLKNLATPMTISIGLGLLLVILNINLEGNVLWETMANVGATTKYFAAIYIGLDFGRKGFKVLFAKPKVFIAMPFKLIVFPIITYLVFGKTGILYGDQLTMLVILTATPTGMAVPLIAKQANSDEAYATAGTMVCTLLCIVTIPFVMWLTTQL
ncbi:MAG: AEC family transporter [Lachnospiraceae bacterium]|nr:AEC family transporter [Lachnospiraceae bacterium]